MPFGSKRPDRPSPHPAGQSVRSWHFVVPGKPGMSGFVRFWTARFYLDEPPRKFLTASAHTGPPDTGPALLHHGLQPILLKRQRFNPSRLVKNFCQGSVKDAGHSGRTLACWSTPPAHTPRPKRFLALVAASWRRESVQSLSRNQSSSLDGRGPYRHRLHGPGPGPPGGQRDSSTDNPSISV